MSSSTTIARNPAQSAPMIFLFSWQIGQVPWERVNSLVTSKAEVAFLTWDGLTFDRLGGLPVAAPLYYGTDVDEEGLPGDSGSIRRKTGSTAMKRWPFPCGK